VVGFRDGTVLGRVFQFVYLLASLWAILLLQYPLFFPNSFASLATYHFSSLDVDGVCFVGSGSSGWTRESDSDYMEDTTPELHASDEDLKLS
jgi:hypothetical protein